ncbi:MAG: Lrp/AsnC family transcriptional regulator [Deltaproteobacteria bacterium HGW-Deltaproteobacteria-9]|nr:MAG: Lrp/AsnC family transcriptional regulator [Deltaproteobacteria bacterium HGW-Deltaproteobacteria-9]
MDDIDKKILNILQKEFPLTERPFLAVAEKCGISEDEVISRVQKLKEKGILRRIGAIFNGANLGRVSTLCAARVPEEKLEKFVSAVNAYSGVTHNYRRNNDYNVWFTVNAASRKEITRFLAELKENTKVTDILEMNAVRTFKIDASFEM